MKEGQGEGEGTYGERVREGSRRVGRLEVDLGTADGELAIVADVDTTDEDAEERVAEAAAYAAESRRPLLVSSGVCAWRVDLTPTSLANRGCSSCVGTVLTEVQLSPLSDLDFLRHLRSRPHDEPLHVPSWIPGSSD